MMKLEPETLSVKDNGGLAERKIEYFRRELQMGNANRPLCMNVTVASGDGFSESGYTARKPGIHWVTLAEPVRATDATAHR